MYDCHHNSRGNTLSTHVADAEEQLLVANEEIKKVATHFTGWSQRTKDIYIITPQAERMGQHLLLDAHRNAQLAADTCLLQIRLLQVTVVLGKTGNNQTQRQQTKQHQDADGNTHLHQLSINLLVIAHHGNLPLGIPFHIGIEHHALVAIVVLNGENEASAAGA